MSYLQNIHMKNVANDGSPEERYPRVYQKHVFEQSKQQTLLCLWIRSGKTIIALINGINIKRLTRAVHNENRRCIMFDFR